MSAEHGLDLDVRVRRDGFVVEAAFTVGAAETVALLGPNGSGKSSLIHAIAGIVPAEAGRIELGGVTLDDDRSRTHRSPEDRNVGIAFQDGILFPNMDVAANVAFPLRCRGFRAGPARERAIRHLDRVAPDVPPGGAVDELSGGERQRVSLARATIGQPAALLLDEPLSAIDAEAKPALREMIRTTLAGFGGPCILVAHDPVDAMTVADRLVILEDGRLTQIGTAAEILDAPRTRYAAELVGVNLFTGRLERLPDGAARLITDDGEITVGLPAGPAPNDAEVLAVLSPSDVTLHSDRPVEGSARNVLSGRITEVSSHGGRARVRLGTSPPLVAEITAGSLQRLGVRAGATAWASFKAVEVRLIFDQASQTAIPRYALGP